MRANKLETELSRDQLSGPTRYVLECMCLWWIHYSGPIFVLGALPSFYFKLGWHCVGNDVLDELISSETAEPLVL